MAQWWRTHESIPYRLQRLSAASEDQPLRSHIFGLCLRGEVDRGIDPGGDPDRLLAMSEHAHEPLTLHRLTPQLEQASPSMARTPLLKWPTVVNRPLSFTIRCRAGENTSGRLSFFNNAAYRGSLRKLLSRGVHMQPSHRLHSFRLFSSCTVAANKIVQIIENKTKGGI